MLDSALAYLSQGWCVIPCEPRGKKPIIPWQKYTTQLPTETEVRTWWTERPDANIAIVCGTVSNLVVVDVDPRHGGSTDNLEQTGRVAETGGGGFHLFYKHPGTNVPNRVGKDGIDVRADGGYVIVAPSVHSSGKSYKWLSEGKPASCPEWVRRAKTDAKSPASERWLADLYENGSGEGSRNDDTTRMAGYYASKKLPLDVTMRLVWDWMSRQRSPLSRQEVMRTVESVYRTALNRIVAERQQKAKTIVAGEDYAISNSELLQQFPKLPMRWQAQDWLPLETVAFIIAAPGSFKSWMTLDLAVSVATGKPFLGKHEIHRPGPVLMFQKEDHMPDVVERLTTIMSEKCPIQTPYPDLAPDEFTTDVHPDLPIYHHTHRQFTFEDPEEVEKLHQLILKYRPELVVIDPLYLTVSSEDHMRQACNEMMCLKNWRDKYKTSFLMVHHTRKSAETAGRLEGHGSQFLNAFQETGWQIRRDPKEEAVIVVRNFKSAKSGEPQRIEFDISTNPAKPRYKVSTEDATEDEVQNATRSKAMGAYVDYIAANDKQTSTEIGLGMEKSKSTVSRVLKKLEDTSAISRNDKGQWSILKLPDF